MTGQQTLALLEQREAAAYAGMTLAEVDDHPDRSAEARGLKAYVAAANVTRGSKQSLPSTSPSGVSLRDPRHPDRRLGLLHTTCACRASRLSVTRHDVDGVTLKSCVPTAFIELWVSLCVPRGPAHPRCLRSAYLA